MPSTVLMTRGCLWMVALSMKSTTGRLSLLRSPLTFMSNSYMKFSNTEASTPPSTSWTAMTSCWLMSASKLIEYGWAFVGLGCLANYSIIGPYLPNICCFHSRMSPLMGVGPVTEAGAKIVGGVYG